MPSVVTTESGLPGAWIDPQPALPLSDATEPVADLFESGEPDNVVTFGQPTALRHGPRWSLRRRKRRSTTRSGGTATVAAEPDTAVDSGVDVDLDLVALDEEERVWTDRALAALEEPDHPDAWMSWPEAIGSTEPSRATTDPWSELTDALEIDDAESSAADRDERTELDLEAEFWT